MILFHDQVHLYDNNQPTPYKAGHISLQQPGNRKPSPQGNERMQEGSKKPQTLEFKRQPFL